MIWSDACGGDASNDRPTSSCDACASSCDERRTCDVAPCRHAGAVAPKKTSAGTAAARSFGPAAEPAARWADFAAASIADPERSAAPPQGRRRSPEGGWHRRGRRGASVVPSSHNSLGRPADHPLESKFADADARSVSPEGAPRLPSEVVRAERQQQDDRDRNADYPKQDGTHNFGLPVARSGSNNGRKTERFRKG